jgi:DNA adenine methylase
VFLCNRDIEDNFYENILEDLLINKYPVTYTAGRRKKTEDGFEAKKATEVLIRNM